MAYYPTAKYIVNKAGAIRITLRDAPYARMVAVAHTAAACLTIQGIIDGAQIREEHGHIVLLAGDVSTAGREWIRRAVESAMASAESIVRAAYTARGECTCTAQRVA